MIRAIRRKTDGKFWRGNRPEDLGGRWVDDINSAKQFISFATPEAEMQKMTEIGNDLKSGCQLTPKVRRPATEQEIAYGEEYLHLFDDCEVVTLVLSVGEVVEL